MGYINLSRWSPNFAFSGDGSRAVQMRSTWLRIAATPDIAGWAMHIGAGVARGTNYLGNTTATAIASADQVETKATAVDLQAFGQVGGNDLAIL